MTDAERALWRGLRESIPGLHWRKQVPFGPYTADFCSHRARLIIEVDGGQHATEASQAYDAQRTRFLESQDYRILRFWNNQVLSELDSVLTAIAAALSSPLVGEDARGSDVPRTSAALSGGQGGLAHGGGPAASAADKIPALASPAKAAAAPLTHSRRSAFPL